MKINIIIPNFYPATIYGGPIFSSLNTSKELAKLNDIEINVSTTNANMTSKLDVQINKNIKFEDDFYVKYYDDTKIDKLSLPLLFNVWKDIKKADIIHMQYMFSTPTPIGLFYSWLFRKPTILSPRGALGSWCLAQGSNFKDKWLKFCIKPFSKNTIWHATAQQEKDEILAIFPNAKVEIIPNGIEYDVFQNSSNLSKKEYVKKFLDLDFEPNKIIVSMGRLQKKKGFDILIDSFFETLKSFPNSLLLIAGGDEGEKENLENQITSLNLQENVFFIGAIGGQDKIDFLANADLFCLPSHNENFGNVYIESLAAGTPIVASKMTPWNEVEDYDCGKWVENSVEKTSQAINEMLSMDRDMMRENSKKLAFKYGWKNIANNFKNLFEKILENK